MSIILEVKDIPADLLEYFEPVGEFKSDVWRVATQPYSGAHFATFPPKLIEPCIMAGCPSKVCAKCGAPWERIIQKPEMPQVESSGLDRYGNGSAGVHRKVGQAYQDWRSANPDRTIGHRPTCDCNGATQPGTVLDPFNGAGTTGLVAIQQKRQYIGCELNPEYAALSRERWKPETMQGRFDLGI